MPRAVRGGVASRHVRCARDSKPRTEPARRRESGAPTGDYRALPLRDRATEYARCETATGHARSPSARRGSRSAEALGPGWD